MIPQVFLKKPPKGLLRSGHPWIYQDQLNLDGVEIPSGTLVDVMTDRGRFIGRGYFNVRSQIAARLLTRQDEPIDVNFFRVRIERALLLRERLVRDTNAMRLVSSEADGLPGLIVDRYDQVLVAQFLTAGMECLRGPILEALAGVLRPQGIYERSDSSSRLAEGLQEKKGWIEKSCGDSAVVYEKDIEYLVEFGEGHKTGLYLDQRESRFFLRQMGIRGRVLDAFCYEGGFGLHLARAGARVIGVDVQSSNLARALLHRKRNSIPEENLCFKEANVFEELKELEKKGDKFELVILDPPSFAKNKASLEGALSGFKEISLRGMRILEKDGLLAIFSCSYHADEQRLMHVALQAASDTRKELRLLHRFSQSADHPINPAIPETHYLKGFLFQVS